jgi:signal transduction histidine kinase
MGFGLLALLRRRTRAEAPAARAPPAPRPVVDVAAVVSEALAGADLPPSISVERPRARHAAFAAVDPGALRDALRALVRAAVASMPAGGAIRIAVRRPGGRIVLEVSDSGPRAVRRARRRAAAGGALRRAALAGGGAGPRQPVARRAAAARAAAAPDRVRGARDV